MQEESATPDGQARRSAATRARLLAAAREIFAADGYQAASTPAIARAAGVSRGALYHQYDDKAALFRDVVATMQAELAERIDAETRMLADDPMAALRTGTLAFLRAASAPDFARIVMIEGPAVLGRDDWSGIDRAAGTATLRDGLAAAMAAGRLAPLPLETLATVLSGAMNEAALLVATAPDPAAALAGAATVLDAVLDGLARPANR
ncbi:MAG: helix-turn-helix domain-containing protein [Pseudomonadota bacterium]|nr:helix-turn-helix domain-containing protein [Pseudomonadota bacterium]